MSLPDNPWPAFGITPRGQPIPQTIEEWKHLGDLYEAEFLKMRSEKSKLLYKISRLEQKIQQLKSRHIHEQEE